jgi:glycosyltransferase involved in cell wall biosynthesis
MRIAQVAPLAESVPPKLYGGTERVVSNLTEELIRQGHEVTLFASGDSVTRARLVPGSERSLRLTGGIRDPLARHLAMLEQVYKDPTRFDIIHFHINYLHFPLTRRMGAANVTTLHGRLDIPDLVPLFREYREMPLISISDAQRSPLPFVNWQGTVYHGLSERQFTLHEKPGGYLAFLGRFSPEKQPDHAIEIAKRLGMELRIAAKVDDADQKYFKKVVEPHLGHPLIHNVGEIGDGQKNDFLGNAHALLFPIEWPEPFGLVLIEAMACGTPVIAYRRGSVPEILEDGVTGFMVEGLDDAVEAARRVAELDRRRCREAFERRFTARRMAEDYLEIYQRLLQPEGAMVS